MIVLALLASAPLPKAPLRDPVAEAVRCPKPRPGEINVCGRDSPEARYRLPQAFRDPGFEIDGPRDSASRERHKLMDVGGAGSLQNACSVVGHGGGIGCMVKDWTENDQQRGFRPPH